MGGTSARGRRRWARRSCRTGGGAGGVVRRTVAAPATTAPRVTEGNGRLSPKRISAAFACVGDSFQTAGESRAIVSG